MNDNNGNGLFNLFLSGFASIIAFLTLDNIQFIFSLVSAIIAIVSGILAARYYFFAAKEKKINIEKLKNNET